MKKEEEEKLKLEAEMGRYYNIIDQCQGTIQNVRPKLQQVMQKLAELDKQPKKKKED